MRLILKICSQVGYIIHFSECFQNTGVVVKVLKLCMWTNQLNHTLVTLVTYLSYHTDTVRREEPRV